MEYYENIKRLRKEKGFTQNKIAEKLQTTQQQYSKYERGIQEITIRQFKRICEILNVSADEILELKKENGIQDAPKK